MRPFMFTINTSMSQSKPAKECDEPTLNFPLPIPAQHFPVIYDFDGMTSHTAVARETTDDE